MILHFSPHHGSIPRVTMLINLGAILVNDDGLLIGECYQKAADGRLMG